MLYLYDLSVIKSNDFISPPPPRGMRHEEQNIAQNASIYISLENIVNGSEKNPKNQTQGNL